MENYSNLAIREVINSRRFQPTDYVEYDINTLLTRSFCAPQVETYGYL